MSITKDEIKHIAELARIGISEKEAEKYQQDMSSILNWIERLKEVDVTEIEPTAHIAGLKNIDRVDKINDFKNKSGIIKLFPEEKDNYDKVKNVF